MKLFLKRHFFSPSPFCSWIYFKNTLLLLLALRILESFLSYPPQWLGTLENPVPLLAFLGLAHVDPVIYKSVLLASFSLCLLSLRSKWNWWSLPLLFLSFLYTSAVDLSSIRPAFSNYVSHSRNLILYMIFLMSLAAFAKLKWKHISNWPFAVGKLTVAAFYFGAAFSKIIDTNFQWMNGYTLQGILYTNHLLDPKPQTLWLADQHGLCQVLSIGLIFLQLSFVFICLRKWLPLLWILGFILFHWGTAYFLNIVFHKYHTLAFIIFLPWRDLSKIKIEPIKIFLRRVFKSPKSSREPKAEPKKNLLSEDLPDQLKKSELSPDQNNDKSFYYLGLPFLLVIYGCVFLRIERWPLSDYSMFSFSHSPTSMSTYRLALSQNQELVQWLYPERASDHHKNPKFFFEVVFIVQTDSDATKQVMAKHLDRARHLAAELEISNSQLALFKQTVVLKENKMQSTKLSFELGLDL